MPKQCLRGTRLVHANFIPWLANVDRILGRDARIDLGTNYSWLAGWATGLDPHQAVLRALDDLEARLCGHA